MLTLPYGPQRSQFGQLRIPAQAERRPGVIVVIHGGFWGAEYGLDLGAGISEDLTRRGWVSWNLEYRRLGAGVGGGGGWPATFLDVAAGIDALASVAGMPADLDLDRVVAVGHSAGGQLAAWAASRPGQPAGAPGASPVVRLRAVVAQAGVLDLRTAFLDGLGGPAVAGLLGGSPAQVGPRYDLASPIERLPIGVPVRCVHGADDTIVPLSQSSGFVSAARRAGDDAELVPVTGGHFAHINAGSSAWRAAVDQLPALLG